MAAVTASDAMVRKPITGANALPAMEPAIALGVTERSIVSVPIAITILESVTVAVVTANVNTVTETVLFVTTVVTDTAGRIAIGAQMAFALNARENRFARNVTEA